MNFLSNYDYIEYSNNEIYKINTIINNVSEIINKVDIILLDWYNYDLFNHSFNTIENINNLIPLINKILEESYITIEIYKNIGNKVTDKIDLIIYCSGIIFFLLVSFQFIAIGIFININKNNTVIR